MLRRLLAAAAMVAALGFAAPAQARDPLAPTDSMPLAQAGRSGGGLGSTNWISGVAGKTYLSERMAVQGTLGFWGYGWRNWGYSGYGWGGIGAAADLVVEQAPFIANEIFGLNWYYGAGPTVGLGTGTGIVAGASGVLGLGFQLGAYPVDVVVEYRPTVFFLGMTGLDLANGSSAVRWWF